MLAHSLFMSGHVGKYTHNTTLLHDTLIVHLCRINICSLPKSTLCLYPCNKKHISFFCKQAGQVPAVHLWNVSRHLLLQWAVLCLVSVIKSHVWQNEASDFRGNFLQISKTKASSSVSEALSWACHWASAGGRHPVHLNQVCWGKKAFSMGSGPQVLDLEILASFLICSPCNTHYWPLDDTIVTTKHRLREVPDSLFLDTCSIVNVIWSQDLEFFNGRPTQK